MASWEDDDFEVPVAAAANDFGEEGEELMGDWEAGLESDDDKPKAVKPKVSSAQRIASRKQKEQEEREKKALEKTMSASKKDMLQREVDADLDTASDLLAAADIHPRSRKKESQGSSSATGPAKLSDFAVFKPTNAAGYTELRKTLAPVINQLAEKNSNLQHTNFIIELCRDLCGPLSSDQTNKVTSTLTAVANQKHREERARRLNNRQKPQIKQASAKQETQVKAPEDLADDGLDDDDFM
ncbi:Eukaryotic translation initiation factor 3 subunit J [Wickerhamiella sorbophila]|uniref:Eukaryotic translation initiation factor 3 30 kDa subunit n=1 Tax=Wickerhamiella sorbophila TaxID=45607 RepID=A0A2T0FNU0_9ASCO|nr:Eukaryotic translation initiation factor 3 subunit J [Wickerhamiella sorbophila]PRT56648.1 Eukaryotic translation initiation factor 3 subunit J [Wickerhamiella sorbophila]